MMLDKNEESTITTTRVSIWNELKMLRWIVILWLGFVLVWGLMIPSGGRSSFPGSQTVLLVLMIIHGAVYWLILSPFMEKKLMSALLIIQAGIFVTISWVTLHMLVSVLLYFTLAGVTILLLTQLRQAILAALGFLTAGIPAYLFYSGYIGIGTITSVYVPVAVFIFAAIILFTQQVNAQTRTQKLLDELADSHRQLEAYAAQVEDLALINERQRIARELHDTLAQGLAGIILQLEAADSHLGSGKTDRAQTIIRQSMIRARAALAESRQVIDHLRKDSSPSLDQLSSAIQEEVERFSTSTGIPVTLRLDANASIPLSQCDCACRAVAEALLNIARHAEASQVWVSLVASTDQLRIEIRDDGAGFYPANRIRQVGHYGLLGLRERARLLGGTLEVDSAPMQGTSIRICLPLETEVEND